MRHPNRDYFMRHKDPVEYITSAAVGFHVEVYWGDGQVLGIGEKPDYYQIMPSSRSETRRRDASEFWDWHLTHNPQWFETPIEAAAAFVRAWKRWPEGGDAK